MQNKKPISNKFHKKKIIKRMNKNRNNNINESDDKNNNNNNGDNDDNSDNDKDESEHHPKRGVITFRGDANELVQFSKVLLQVLLNKT